MSSTPETGGLASSVEELAAQEAREKAEAKAGAGKADPLEEQRAKWRAQKESQRQKKAAGGGSSAGAGAPARAPAPPRAPAAKPVTIDPRVLERISRILAAVEQRGGAALAGGIHGAIDAGYPAFPLGPKDAAAVQETSALYVEIRSKDLLEWLLNNPRIAVWLPEIILGGTALALIVPRAIATVQMKRAGRDPSVRPVVSTVEGNA